MPSSNSSRCQQTLSVSDIGLSRIRYFSLYTAAISAIKCLFFPPIETSPHPSTNFTVSPTPRPVYINNIYVEKSTFSTRSSNIQQFDKFSRYQMRRRLRDKRRPGKARRKAFDDGEGLVEWVAGQRRFRRPRTIKNRAWRTCGQSPVRKSPSY